MKDLIYNPLISLIVPCYNISNKCDDFFKSLINQTYTKIQLILVNDGSTDDTENKIFSYKEELENKGYIFEYYYQDNKGLGGAINTGLKKIDGEFFCWADPDDYYENNAFEIRVDYFRENPECSVLTCGGYDVKNNERTLIKYPKNHFDRNQFYHLLNYGSLFCSGCHMIRTKSFKEVNPNMDIFEARRGQDWQLLLPLYYKFDRHCLDVPIYNYVIYDDSMSHSDDSYEKKIKRYEENEEIQIETINRMLISKEEKMRIISKIEKYHLIIKLNLAYSYRKKKDFNSCYQKAITQGKISIKCLMKKILINI